MLRLIVARRARRSVMGCFTILMYHRVVAGKTQTQSFTQPGMSVVNNTFKEQLDFLTDKCRLTGLGHLIQRLSTGGEVPARTVVVTFDDGWRDNYTEAFPLLRDTGAPATVFVCTDALECGGIFWFLKIGAAIQSSDQGWRALLEVLSRLSAPGDCTSSPESDWIDDCLAAVEAADSDLLIERLKLLDGDLLERIADDVLKRAGVASDLLTASRWFLNWDETREMQAGGIDFGSHGLSHRILTRISTAAALREMSESKRILEDRLGQSVDVLAYPNGDYDAAVQELVRQAGYKAAIATRPASGMNGAVDLWALPRVGIHEGVSMGWNGRFSRALFACAIHRVFPCA